MDVADQKKNGSILDSGERRVIWTSVLIVLTCTLPLFDPTSGGFPKWNSLLVRAIPPEVGLVMLTLPLWLFFSYVMKKYVDQRDKEREKNIQEFLSAKTEVLFRCSYKEETLGSAWELINTGKDKWTNAKLIIEKQAGQETISKRFDLGDVIPGQRIVLRSKLTTTETTRWRVLVVCEEGLTVDFPSRWIEPLWEAADAV